MKCLECGADIYEGIKKCPYCKTLTPGVAVDERFRNFDFKYTITSDEQVKKIHDTIRETEKEKGKKKSKLEAFLAKRRAAKRAARREARRRAAEQTEVKATVEKTKPVKAEKKAKKKVQLRKLQLNKINFKKPAPEEMKKVKKQALGMAAIAVCLVVLIWGVVAIAGAISGGDDNVASYTYAKDNSLYMIYKGKNILISEKLVSDSYTRKLDEEGTLVSAERAAKNAGLIHSSKDGKVTYFFEEYDPETNSGRLCMIKNGKNKKITPIAEAVHNSIVMTDDGERLLYLQTTDKNGDMGVLYYWEKGMDEPFKISTDIDHETFGFADGGNYAMFLQNLNRVEMRGDLYVKNLSKLKEEKLKLDTDVCKIFGSSQDGDSHLYAKDYDAEDKSFDIYAINRKNRSIRLGERTKKNPVMQKKKNNIYILGIDDDGTNNLYNVEVDSGKKEKIASGVSNVIMMSKDEKTVIYDKVYSGKLADYYAYTRGKQIQKIAGNVVVDYNVVAGKPQMAASLDAKKIIYISEFEAFKGGGTLTLCEYNNGKIVSQEKIAEDVYSCYRAEDGKFIFTKDYSPSRKVYDVYVLDGSEPTLLKEEVSPEMFGVNKSGDTIYYISNYNVEGSFGTLEKMDIDGNIEEIAAQVFGFNLSAFEDVLFYKNLNSQDGSFGLYLLKDGKTDWNEVNTSIDEILTY